MGLENISSTAMILAAGYGKRLRPVTENIPKPLVKVSGKAMIDYALDHLRRVGIKKVVINTHYLAEQIVEHLSDRNNPSCADIETIVVYEPTILDTGGGVRNMLRTYAELFGNKPFITMNADIPWWDHDDEQPSLQRLADFWDNKRMDAAMLVMLREQAYGFGPNGDFNIEADGRIWRKGTAVPRSRVWISAQIISPQLVEDYQPAAYQIESDQPGGAPGDGAMIFSNNCLWDIAEARSRLYGLDHKGECYHVGTPEDLIGVEEWLLRRNQRAETCAR